MFISNNEVTTLLEMVHYELILWSDRFIETHANHSIEYAESTATMVDSL